MTTPTPDTRRVEYRRLADLVPADRNPKAHDADMIDGSLDTFGYVELIAEDGRTGKLIAGHGRLEGLARREQARPDEPPDGVIRGDDGAWLVPILVGWSSKDDDEAEGYLLISNRAAMAGGWQTRPLAEYLADLDSRAPGLRRLGWDDEDYASLVVDAGALAEQEGRFLDDLAGGDETGSDPGPRPRGAGADVVDLRLPMADRQRDEAVALLRQHQRALTDAGRPAATLSDTVLEVLRTWALT